MPAHPTASGAGGHRPPAILRRSRAVARGPEVRCHAGVALLFMAIVVMVIAVSVWEWYLIVSRRKPAVLAESPFVASALVTE